VLIVLKFGPRHKKTLDLENNQVLGIHKTTEYYDDPLQHFTYALRAPETKRQYPKRLKMFMDFVKIEGDLKQQSKTLKEKIKEEPEWFKVSLIRFFEYQKERARKNDIAFSTISNYYKAIKLFVDMNFDAPVINWKKISKGIPSGRKSANDRAPTLEELKLLSEYPDRRIKPIVYLMASSGIRIGAFDTLKWNDIHPITKNNEFVGAKLVVYAGDEEEYFTFMTPEAYSSIKEWMDFRESHGEKITSDSWIMRDLWQTTEMNYGAKFGVATYPKQLKSSGIKSLIERALKAQGLVKPLNKQNKERRREWKGAHGLRKFYQTTAEKVMKSINVEITMGHNIGITASYYKPNEKEVLDDYLKAVDLLTISQNNAILDKK
jgi:integrase